MLRMKGMGNIRKITALLLSFVLFATSFTLTPAKAFAAADIITSVKIIKVGEAYSNTFYAGDDVPSISARMNLTDAARNGYADDVNVTIQIKDGDSFSDYNGNTFTAGIYRYVFPVSYNYPNVRKFSNENPPACTVLDKNAAFDLISETEIRLYSEAFTVEPLVTTVSGTSNLPVSTSIDYWSPVQNDLVNVTDENMEIVSQSWFKQTESSWNSVAGSLFTTGTYRYQVQLKALNGGAFPNEGSITIGGTTWDIQSRPSADVVWVKSGEYTVGNTILRLNGTVDLPDSGSLYIGTNVPRNCIILDGNNPASVSLTQYWQEYASVSWNGDPFTGSTFSKKKYRYCLQFNISGGDVRFGDSLTIGSTTFTRESGSTDTKFVTYSDIYNITEDAPITDGHYINDLTISWPGIGNEVYINDPVSAFKSITDSSTDSGYYDVSVKVNKYTSSSVSSEYVKDTFEAGNYDYVIYLTIKPEYRDTALFTRYPAGSLNGEQVTFNLVKTPSLRDWAKVYYRHGFTVSKIKSLTAAITCSGLDDLSCEFGDTVSVPAVSPALSVSSPEISGFSLSDPHWEKGGTAYSGETFEAGTYDLVTTVTPPSGLSFADNVTSTVTVNGQSATVVRSTSGSIDVTLGRVTITEPVLVSDINATVNLPAPSAVVFRGDVPKGLISVTDQNTAVTSQGWAKKDVNNGKWSSYPYIDFLAGTYRYEASFQVLKSYGHFNSEDSIVIGGKSWNIKEISSPENSEYETITVYSGEYTVIEPVTVSFSVEGDTSKINSITIAKGSKIPSGTLIDPGKGEDGFVFCWYQDPGMTEEKLVEDIKDVAITTDTTFYGKWVKTAEQIAKEEAERLEAERRAAEAAEAARLEGLKNYDEIKATVTDNVLSNPDDESGNIESVTATIPDAVLSAYKEEQGLAGDREVTIVPTVVQMDEAVVDPEVVESFRELIDNLGVSGVDIQYCDIGLAIVENGNVIGTVTETSHPIEVKVRLKDGKLPKYVGRYHNGKSEILGKLQYRNTVNDMMAGRQGLFNDADTTTAYLYSTDFSVYAFIYETGAEEPEPVIEPEPVVEPEPVAEPDPVIEPEPAIEPEPVIEPKPVVEPEPVIEPDPEPEYIGKVPVHRLLNTVTGSHFYTVSEKEADEAINKGYKYEGYAFWAPETSAVPVYRLYNNDTDEHYYTTDNIEAQLLSNNGYTYEGIAWYSEYLGGQRVYLLRSNENLTVYTISVAERDMLKSQGWEEREASFLVCND